MGDSWNLSGPAAYRGTAMLDMGPQGPLVQPRRGAPFLVLGVRARVHMHVCGRLTSKDKGPEIPRPVRHLPPQVMTVGDRPGV